MNKKCFLWLMALPLWGMMSCDTKNSPKSDDEIRIISMCDSVVSPLYVPETLEGTDIYIDYSECFVGGNVDRGAYKNLIGTLTSKAKNENVSVYSIEGDSIVLQETGKKAYKVFNDLAKKTEVKFSNLEKAFEIVANSDRNAFVLTDCEYFSEKGECNDKNPYLQSCLEKWIFEKHREVFVFSEPYQESRGNLTAEKKRFYFWFTTEGRKTDFYEELVKSLGKEKLFLSSSFSPSQIKVNFNDKIKATKKNEVPLYYSWGATWESIQKIIKKYNDNVLTFSGVDKNYFGGLELSDFHLKVYALNEPIYAFVNENHPISTISSSERNYFFEMKEDDSDKGSFIVSFPSASQIFNPNFLEGYPTNFFRIDLFSDSVKLDDSIFENELMFESIVQGNVINNSSLKYSVRSCYQKSVIDSMKGMVLKRVYVKTGAY